MDRTTLSVYLNDHWAGSTAGVKLAERLRADHVGTAHEGWFTTLAADIAEDRTALRTVMARLGIEQKKVRSVVGWVSEEASRVRLHPRVTGSATLSTMLGAEALVLGIQGKRGLWAALQAVASDELPDVDLPHLVERAEAQAAGLEALRLRPRSSAAAVSMGERPPAGAGRR